MSEQNTVDNQPIVENENVENVENVDNVENVNEEIKENISTEETENNTAVEEQQSQEPIVNNESTEIENEAEEETTEIVNVNEENVEVKQEEQSQEPIPESETVPETVQEPEPEVLEEENKAEDAVEEPKEEEVQLVEEPVPEENPKEKLDDSIPLVQEANKDLLIRSNSDPSQIAPLEADDVDYNDLSKEELIEKINFLKEQCKIIKQETDKKIKNTNDYIERLEEATEQRLDRLRKQNKDDIDEIKKFSDQMIKTEKEKAETYVKNMKKSVDDEREVLRQIENDSRSRFQKEKEEKNEALVEINRLKSIINSLHNDVEDREIKIQNLEENNLSVFVQKDKELEQAINQIENERKYSKELKDENMILKEKINELMDELKQFKNESEIRNSQINLLNTDNQQMHKKISSLSRKNEELNNLYEIKKEETSSLKNQIETLNAQIEILKKKRKRRLTGISPLTPSNNVSTPIDPNASRCFSEYSMISAESKSASASASASANSKNILDALNDNEISAISERKNSGNTNDELSDISLGYNEQNNSVVVKDKDNQEEDEEGSVVNHDGIVTMNKINPGTTTEVETIEGNSNGSEVGNTTPNANSTNKPEQRTLVIDTNMTINNNGGDPAFNYQEDNLMMDPNEEDEDDDDEEEETVMGSMVKPLVFHTNDQTYINFNQILKEGYEKIYGTKLVKQCELEEIVQCLDLNGTYMGFFSKRKLLNGLKNNTVVIEKANNERIKDLMIQDIEPECALCSLKYITNEKSMIWYQFFFEDEKNSNRELICMFCRERLVTICNWYKYLSMIANRIIKQDIEGIYINCLQLKENMYHARNGLTTDDENNNNSTTISTNPRAEIITQRDFTEVDINKKNSFDNANTSADSITLKNNSEILDGPPSTNPNKRPSLCYNSTIQMKTAISPIN